MLKEALKWVADHAGISWVLGKLSSGWKWLFSSKTYSNENPVPKQSGEEKPATQHNPSQNLVNEAVNYLKVKDKRLYLNLTKENFEKCENYHYSNNESAFFNKEYGGNKFRMYIKHDEKEFRIIGTPDGGNCRIDIDLIIERDNSVNDKGKEVRFSIHKSGNVQLSHGIGVTVISKKNHRGEYIHNFSILNMVETALQRKVAVTVPSEQSVTQAVMPDQLKKEKPTEQNNAAVVDQTTAPEQQPKVSNNQHTQEQTEPKAYVVPANVNHIRIDSTNLVFSIMNTHLAECQSYINPYNKEELLFFIQCGKKEYHITGILSEHSLYINSIVELKDAILFESDVLCPSNHMETIKENLGLLSGQLLPVDGITRLSVDFIKTQQNGEPVVEDTISDSTTTNSVSEHFEAQEDVQTDSRSDFDSESDTETITNAHFDTTRSNSMTGSTDSFFSSISGVSKCFEDPKILGSTDQSPQSGKIKLLVPKELSNSFKEDVQDVVAEMPKAQQQKIESMRNGKKRVCVSPELSNSFKENVATEMPKSSQQIMEDVKNGKVKLHFSLVLSEALHYLHKESLQGNNLLVPNSLFTQLMAQQIAGEKSL